MAISKKTFDKTASQLDKIKKKHSSPVQLKADRFFDLGPAFLDATGIPGPAMGHMNMFLGHTDTGKTTAMVKTAVDAQKKGILPVFIITEQKWDFNHAKLMGLDVQEVVDEETGDITYDGFFIFRNDFSYIEQITEFINTLLDEQDKGGLDYDMLFVWDSVGSVPCKMTFEGKGGKQHNASALSDKIGMGLNQRITGSRNVKKKFTNTLLIVNQPWVELPDNPYGQPKIKAKGGESIWLNATLVFLFGNQKNSGTSKITITKNKRKIKFGSITKISIIKNHVNGLGYEDGKILVTAHGFMPGRDDVEKKSSIETYKQEHSDYWMSVLGVAPGDEVSDIDTGDLVIDIEEDEEQFLSKITKKTKKEEEED